MSDVDEDEYLGEDCDEYEHGRNFTGDETSSDEEGYSCSEDESDEGSEQDQEEVEPEFQYNTSVGIRLRLAGCQAASDKENQPIQQNVQQKQKRVAPDWSVQSWPANEALPEVIKKAKEAASNGAGWTSERRYVTGDTAVLTAICKAKYLFGCESRLRIEETPNVTLLKVLPHDHAVEKDRSKGIPKHVKQEMLNALNTRGVKPSQVYRRLVELNVQPMINKKQVAGFVKRFKKSKAYQLGVKGTYGGLQAWSDENSLEQAIAKAQQAGTSPEHAIGHVGSTVDAASNKVCIVLTSKHLLGNLAKSQALGQSLGLIGGQISIDGTYSVNWNKLPVIFIGCVDYQQRFHAAAACIVSDEKEEMYATVMRTVATAVKQHCNVELQPAFAMSDAAHAIRNAGATVFPTAKWLNCFSHLKIQGLRRSGGGLRSKLRVKEHAAVISLALNKLHACTDSTVYEHGLSLFITYLETVLGEHEFSRHFQAEYFGDVAGNWSQSSGAPTIPTTNNGLERFNRTFKSTGTYYERCSLEQFLGDTLPSYLRVASVSSAQDGFATEPCIVPAVWDAALAMVQTDIMPLVLEGDNEAMYMLSSNAFVNLVPGDMDARGLQASNAVSSYLSTLNKPEMHSSLDALYDSATSVYTLHKLGTPRGQFIHYDCTCTHYYHYGYCKHSLAYSVHNQLCSVPASRVIKPVGQVAAVGRPPKAKGAWVRDALQPDSQGLSQRATQGLSQRATQGLSQPATQGLSQRATQGLSQRATQEYPTSPPKPPAKRGRGRPPGSRNKPKAAMPAPQGSAPSRGRGRGRGGRGRGGGRSTYDE